MEVNLAGEGGTVIMGVLLADRTVTERIEAILETTGALVETAIKDLEVVNIYALFYIH